jgi:desampylase
MRVRIFSTAAEQILAHAAREHPREVCGLLLGREGLIDAAVEAANIADDPETTFEIDPAVLLRVHREAREGGPALLGWYHSHPNGRCEPSAADAGRAVEAGKIWMIVAAGQVEAWLALGQGSFEPIWLEKVANRA